VKVDLVLLKASRQPTEVFQFGEAPFDALRLLIQGLLVLSFDFALGSGWDDGFGAAGLDVLDNRLGSVAFVGQHGLGFPLTQEPQRLPTIGHWPGGHHKVQRLAQLIAQPVNFGRQPSSGTPQSLVRAPFFRPVAAC
jgi:hypothetical protein